MISQINFIQLRQKIPLFHKLMLKLIPYYSRLLSSLNSPTIKFLFSDASKRQVSANAQRSVLATAIIREILSSQPPINFSGLSLRDKLIKLNPLIDNTQISPQIKDQIFKIFTSGVVLNPKVYSSFQAIGKNQQGKRLVFCPNYLTTRQIFKEIINQSENQEQRLKNLFLIGGHGMAKTISFILYMHVSNYIHRFYQQAQCSQEAKLEFQQLSKENLIKVVPRCWYWGISPAHHNNDRFSVTNLIFQQTIDLPSQKRAILKKHLQDSDEFKFHFLKFYPDQIQKRVIIDQVQTMILMAREWKLIYQSKKNKIQKYNDSSKNDLFTNAEVQLNFGFRQLMVHLDELQIYGDNYIFSSSIGVEDQQLKRSKGYNLAVGIYGNQRPKIVQIQSSRSLVGEKWGVVDFWQYFWFQIQRTLIDKQVSINLQEAKKAFFKNCEEKAVGAKSYFRFSDITNFLNSQAVCKSINGQSNKEHIEKTLCELRELFTVFCLQEQTKKINKFIEKGRRDQKIKYISELHKLAIAESSKGNKDLVVEQNQLTTMDKHDQVMGYRQKSENNKKTIIFNLSSNELAFVLNKFFSQINKKGHSVQDTQQKSKNKQKDENID